jgi:DNA anti-recombination protein RmuC
MMRETMEEADGMAADDTSTDRGGIGGSGAALPDFAMALRGYDRLQVDDYLERQQRWAADVELRLSDAEHRAEAGEAAAAALRARLAELEAKQEEDADGPPRSIAALGDRVGRILQTAWDAGEEVRDEVVSSARAEALEVERRAAERDAEATAALDRARVQAGEILAAAEQSRHEAEAEAARIREEAEGTARVRAAELVTEAEATAERVRNDATASAERTIEAAERHRDELQQVIAGLVQRRDAAMAELDRVRAALEQVVAAPGVSPTPPTDPEPRVH